jgi:small GTP-binding protein
MGSPIEEQIKEVQAEIDKTQVNKHTEYHIGKLKAKIARLKMEADKRRSQGGGGGKSYSVKKSGNATVAFVGFPSVGKSTLLNKLTDAESEVGAYDFTTIDVVPGIMEYKGAKIQVLDLPGLIRDASKGKGRGREVLSVVRSADLILFIMDPYDTNLHVLINELEVTGIRLNTRAPDVVVTRRDQGGIEIKPTIELTKISEELAKDIVSEYGYVNADVVIREDINVDQLIDVLTGNRIYMKAILAINKVDTADEEFLKQLKKKLKAWHPVFISAKSGIGLDDLKDDIFTHIDLIRIYLKKQGQEVDMKEPLIVRKDSSVGDVCDSLHRVFRQNFRYATVWGDSAKFPGQMVGLDHDLKDGDILSVIIKRTGE